MLKRIAWPAAIAALFLGCSREQPAIDHEPTRPPASSPSAPGDPLKIQIGERAAAASHCSDGGRWVAAFRFKLLEDSGAGKRWAEARGACIRAGLDLCTQDQWAIACGLEPAVGRLQSWTVTYAGSEDHWVVAGGLGCEARSAKPANTAAPDMVGLCCERRASLDAVGKSEAKLREADTYLRMVEEALNAKRPEPTLALIADPAELFGTTRDHADARKALEWTYQNWVEMDSRLTSCDVRGASGSGTFECDTVMTRFRKGQPAKELSVFRQRYVYGPPAQKYSIFGKGVSTSRKFSAM